MREPWSIHVASRTNQSRSPRVITHLGEIDQTSGFQYDAGAADPADAAADDKAAAAEKSSADVVSLDAFRKKP